jgi:glycine cleavage system H protein
MVALLVVLTIVVFVAADAAVQWRKSKREAAARKWADDLAPAYAFEGMSAPAGVYLDEGHTWVQVSPLGRADVGVDSFAQRLIGRVEAVDLPEVGRAVRRGDFLFALRQGDRRAAFAAPVDGVVSAVDKELAWRPELVEADPYKDGRVCSINPKNLARNLRLMRVAEEGRDWLKEEVRRFHEFFAARPLQDTPLGRVLQDGGQPTGGVLELLDDATWKEFNELFLRPRTQGQPN